MGYPLIDEFCRINGLGACQPSFFRRCQREFREHVQPMLDERDRLLVETVELREANAQLTARLSGKTKEKAA